MTRSAPIFVLGAERSGTTLLRLILDAHPAIAIGPESGFLRAVQDTLTIREWHAGHNWFERFGVDRADMAARLADLYGGMFTDYAHAQGKRRWGDKSPMHRWLVDLALELFPDAVFVGIVRHPGAVCTSRARWNYPRQDNVDMWVRAAHRMVVDRDRIGAERFTILRYEDLLRDPEPVLRDLVDFLGEEWSDRLVAHHEEQRGGDEVTDGGTRTTDPMDPSRIDAWLEQAAAEDVEAIAAATSPWRERFGYTATGTLPAAQAPALQPHAVEDASPVPQLVRRDERLAAEVDRLRARVDALEDRTAEAEAAAANARNQLQRLQDRRYVRLGQLLLDGARHPSLLLERRRWRRALENR